MYAQSPITQEFVNVAHTVFVDDLATSYATANNSEAVTMSEVLSRNLDAAFEPHGIAQNREKAITIFQAKGPGSVDAVRSMCTAGLGHVSCARYLGPVIHYLGHVGQEVSRRIKAAWGAWHMYKSLWSSKADTQF